MKKYLLTILLALGVSPLFSQSVDSTSIFQYRVGFSQDGSFSPETLSSNMRDLFKSNIDFNQTLNQFIFTTKEDITQADLSKNLDMIVTYFKKIDLTKLRPLGESTN